MDSVVFVVLPVEASSGRTLEATVVAAEASSGRTPGATNVLSSSEVVAWRDLVAVAGVAEVLALLFEVKGLGDVSGELG